MPSSNPAGRGNHRRPGRRAGVIADSLTGRSTGLVRNTGPYSAELELGIGVVAQPDHNGCLLVHPHCKRGSGAEHDLLHSPGPPWDAHRLRSGQNLVDAVNERPDVHIHDQ
jgi:hypothetical protein